MRFSMSGTVRALLVLKKFVQVYQSPEVKDFINKTFEGAVIAAW